MTEPMIAELSSHTTEPSQETINTLAPFLLVPRTGVGFRMQFWSPTGVMVSKSELLAVVGVPGGAVFALFDDRLLPERSLADLAARFEIAEEELRRGLAQADTSDEPLSSLVLLDANGDEVGVFLDKILTPSLPDLLRSRAADLTAGSMPEGWSFAVRDASACTARATAAKSSVLDGALWRHRGGQSATVLGTPMDSVASLAREALMQTGVGPDRAGCIIVRLDCAYAGHILRLFADRSPASHTGLGAVIVPHERLRRFAGCLDFPPERLREHELGICLVSEKEMAFTSICADEHCSPPEEFSIVRPDIFSRSAYASDAETRELVRMRSELPDRDMGRLLRQANMEGALEDTREEGIDEAAVVFIVLEGNDFVTQTVAKHLPLDGVEVPKAPGSITVRVPFEVAAGLASVDETVAADFNRARRAGNVIVLVSRGRIKVISRQARHAIH